MKNLSKLLYIILGIIVAICLFILFCGMNPDVSKGLKEWIAENAPKKEAAAEETTNNVATAATSEATVEPEPEPEDEEDSEENYEYNYDLTYDDYVNDWDPSTVSQDTQNNPEYQDFVDAFLHPQENTDDGNYPEDKSDMQSPQPKIVDIEDEEKAKERSEKLDPGDTGEGLTFDPLFYPYYHMLNSRGQALYKQIYANALAQKKKFAPVLSDANDNEILSAFCCVLDDHPELFWVDISFYTQYDYQGKAIEFDFKFYKNFNDIQYARMRFDNISDNLIAGAKDLESAYEKELYIHDVIVDKLNYQHNSLDQSAYSSVVDNYTVCAGYARCFQYLMQRLEVPAYNCTGWGGRERHAWNIVLLDDGYHNVDVTWDDSGENYDFFNLSDAENKHHRRMDFSVYLPKCVESDHKPKFAAKAVSNPSVTVNTDGDTASVTVNLSSSASNRPYHYNVDSDGNVIRIDD